jgi:WD40 repeat protein
MRNVETGAVIWNLIAGYMPTICYSSDNKQIIGGNYGSGIRIWSADTGTLVKILGESSFVSGYIGICYSPDNEKIIAGYNNNIKIYDIASGKLINTFTYNLRSFCCLMYPDFEFRKFLTKN